MRIALNSWKIRIKNIDSMWMIERLIHIVMLLLFMGAFYHLFKQIGGESIYGFEDDSIQKDIIIVLGYILSLSFVFSTPKRMLNTLLQLPLIWIVIGLAVLSSFWSEFPLLTLRSSVALILTTLYAITLLTRFSFDQVIGLLGWTFWIALALSLFLIVFMPDLGKMNYQGQVVWRGVFNQKNQLGNIAVLALLFHSVLLSRSKGISRFVWTSGIVTASIMIISSRSTTAIILSVVLVFSTVVLLLLRYLHKDWQFTFPIVVVLTLVGIGSVATNLDKILLFFGKEISLTGRIPLWNKLLSLGKDHFWLGYGFNAFWLGWQGPSSQVWWDFPTWLPKSAHNSYLNMWLELGLVGLLLVILLLFWLFAVSFRLYLRDHKNGIFLLLLTLYIITLNFVETILLYQNSLYLILFLYMFGYVSVACTKPKGITR